MRSRILSAIICLLLAVSPLWAALCAADSAANEVAALIDSTVSFKVKSSGADSVQGLIDTSLSKAPGTSSQWYVLALRQYEKSYDFSAYAAALQSYVAGNSIDNAVTRQRCALTLIACGYKSSFVTQTVNSTVGEMGIMSRVFGLHLVNNGFNSLQHTADEIIGSLLSLHLPDGGWAVSGDSSDVDVTAMVLQALAPYAKSNPQVRSAADSAVNLLSSRQLASGNFKSYGVENPESTSQVITALSALGIDCLSDSRFIKNGNSLLDGLKKYRLADGSFCHEAGGGSNNTATYQALYALVALWRNLDGRGSFYLFPYPTKSFSSPAAVQTQRPVTTAVQRTTAPETSEATTRERRTAAAYTPVTRTSKKHKAELTSAPCVAAQSSTVYLTVPASQSVTSSSVATTDFVTDASETTCEATTQKAAPTVAEKRDFKKIAVIAVWVTAAIACAVLFVCGKRKAVNFIAVAVIAAALTATVTTLDFESKDSFYSQPAVTGAGDTVTVTFSIGCGTVAGKSDKDYIPADGVILGETQFTVSEGSTVFDVLMLAAKQYNIQVENDAQTGGDYSTAYIAGINYIYEFDFGDLSGWVYRVNGSVPSVGCGAYTLADGDTVEWLYTCNLGDDLI